MFSETDRKAPLNQGNMKETKTNLNKIMQPEKIKGVQDYKPLNFNLKCYLSMESIPRFDLSKSVYSNLEIVITNPLICFSRVLAILKWLMWNSILIRKIATQWNLMSHQYAMKLSQP